MNQEIRSKNNAKDKKNPILNSLVMIDNPSGYIALITVIILSAVTMAIGTTVSLLAIGEAQSSQALTKGEETLGFVEGCMEDALLKVRASDSYAGGEYFTA